jgi:hypothetical protein
MHARKVIRDIIIGKKLRRWSLIAQYSFIDPTYPRARARKNFWRLLRSYPEIAAKLGLNEGSVYG